MRDVSAKITTLRTATAKAVLHLAPATVQILRDGKVPKGDPLPVAKVAAIQAAKETSRIIPYCHPLPIEWVGVEFDVRDDQIEARVSVRTIHKTGVEMEALTAATVAVLTIYDMLKMLDEEMWVDGVVLLSKIGGKSDFVRGDGRRAAVISVGMDASEQTATLIAERLEAAGVGVAARETVSSEGLSDLVRRFADQDRYDLILTTGGTGLGAADDTPEALSPLLDREIPGIAEAMRTYGGQRVPTSMLARGIAGQRGQTLIVALPDAPGGVTDALDSLLPGLLHAMEAVRN